MLVGAFLLSAVLLPADAMAQLRGLGSGSLGSGSLGSGSLGGVGSIGAPSTGAIGSSSLGTGLPSDGASSSALPGATSTIAAPIRPPVNTVTNTLTGDIGRPAAALGNSVNNAANRVGNAGAVRPGQSRVPPPGERRFVPNEVLIGLPSNLTADALDALARRHGLVHLEAQRIALTGTTFHRWRIADARSIADVVRELEADRGVSLAQPNYRFTLQQSDAEAAQSADIAYAAGKLHLAQAHELATGGEVLIALIDGAIDANHTELAGSVVATLDTTDAPDGDATSAFHATAMAGSIIAHARLSGVAPAARILAIRAFASVGGRTESTTLSILKGIDLAVARRARVINMSFAGPLDPEIQRSLGLAYKKGIVLVAAAGNAGPQSPPLYPAADPNVIAVTATDSTDHLFAQSNRGRYIAVAAPGVEVIAPAPRETYQVTTGTSVATAEVSGIAALLIGLKPGLTPQGVRQALTATARHLGPGGRNDEFGAGLADAYKAVLSLTAEAAAGKAGAISASR
jgi:hypothetical protein